MDYQVEVSNLLTPMLKGVGLLSDEFKNIIASGLQEYLYSQTEKYFFTNNFLHRSEKVKFRNFYYPIRAICHRLITQFENPSELLEDYKKIILIGSAGSGKSTLVQYIFLKIVDEKKLIPILIQLRDLNTEKASFENLVFERILNGNVKPNKAILKRSLKKGKYLFLLDGFDEIFSNRKQGILIQLEKFIDLYNENKFIITTRPGSGIEMFRNAYKFEILPLLVEEIPNFLIKNIIDEERRNRIQAVIFKTQDTSYIEYLTNPLLLSMFILAFESHPEIPSRKSAFYSNVFDTLYSKHDGITKLSFIREKRTNFLREDFDKILSLFCYISLAKGIYKFTSETFNQLIEKIKQNIKYKFDSDALLEDLYVQISILILDGFEYTFPHRSLQEYFAAKFLSSLPADKKGKAFDNMYKGLVMASSDNSLTFWLLCEELDEISFYSYFLIPRLEEFTKIHDTNPFTLVRNFVALLKLDATFDRKVYMNSGKKFKTINDKAYFVFGPTLIYTILKYCVNFEYSKIVNFLDESKAGLALTQEFPDEFIDQNFGKNFLYREEVIPILVEYDFPSLVKDLISKVCDTILFYKARIDERGISLDELLNY